ncbi:hypothetical protein F4776DRAFT_659606 [Hypoxylon sp. NC0597]|nr:hypothetical protein F4776DRAFT_659606 [Hypoxylon sp. NC0597]
MSTTRSQAPQNEETRNPSRASASVQGGETQDNLVLWNYGPDQNTETHSDGTAVLAEEPAGWDVTAAQAGQAAQPANQFNNALSGPVNAANPQAMQGNFAGFYYASLHDLTRTFNRTEQLVHSKWLAQQGVNKLFMIDHCDLYRYVPHGFKLELVAMYRERHGGNVGWWKPSGEIFWVTEQSIIDVANDLNARKQALGIPH